MTYDATADFSSLNNPNGVWSSGYTISLGSSFVLYDQFTSSSDIHAWTSSTASGVNFEKNMGTTTQFGIQPGQISLHPGAANEFSVLRFTVPTAGE